MIAIEQKIEQLFRLSYQKKDLNILAKLLNTDIEEYWKSLIYFYLMRLLLFDIKNKVNVQLLKAYRKKAIDMISCMTNLKLEDEIVFHFIQLLYCKTTKKSEAKNLLNDAFQFFSKQTASNYRIHLGRAYCLFYLASSKNDYEKVKQILNNAIHDIENKENVSSINWGKDLSFQLMATTCLKLNKQALADAYLKEAIEKYDLLLN